MTEQVRDVSDETIERRAFEISEQEDAGTAEENWRRAERELRRGPRVGLIRPRARR